MNISNIYTKFGHLLSANGSFWGHFSHQNRSFPESIPSDFLFAGHEPSTIVLVIMYLISFLIGLGGNTMALLVLTRKKNRLAGASATRRLLINLAVCDMLVVCVCMPVNLGHQVYNAWVFGDFLCQAVPFVQAVSVSASVLSLAVISLNRYYSVHNPFHARAFFTGRKIMCMISVVWTVSSVLCFPLIFMNRVKTLSLLDGLHSLTVCVESWPKVKLRQGYNFLLFCSLYVFPVVFNLIISLLTGWKLWGTREELSAHCKYVITQSVSRLKMRKRIAKMVLALVVLFTFSWLPLYVIDIWIDFNMPSSTEEDLNHVEHVWILQGRPFAQWLGLTNSALNPLCYCFVGNLYRSAKKFRESYRRKISSIFSLPVQQPTGKESIHKLYLQKRASSEKCTGKQTWSGFSDKLMKSKSMSSITVCETVFD